MTKDVYGEHTFYKAYVHSRYAYVLHKMGKYENAYKNIISSQKINNTYLNPRNENNQDFLIIKNQYRNLINKQNKLLNSQKLKLVEKTQKILYFRIFFFIVLFFLILIGLLAWYKMKSLKHKEQQDISKQIIDFKNKELTSNTLRLIEKEGIIKTLSDHVRKHQIDTTSKTLLKSIEKRSKSLWDDFNNRFTEQNTGFYERLQKKAPNLSSSDLKICALIKLNFSGKEMAYLLGISLGSVHVARHRLRKKMNLEREINLTTFITSI